ncbi:hypothetical protein RINTHM_16300 [Richelia intracellularis HM01]|nr:hypothetical protein RINTHM_16300 [Richelia intracellularis HM01]
MPSGVPCSSIGSKNQQGLNIYIKGLISISNTLHIHRLIK